MLKIILVDGHPVVRSGVKTLLDNSSDLRVVAETDNAQQAYQLFIDNPSAIVLLDIDLPETSSLTLLSQIVARNELAKVIIFSGHEEISFAVQSISAGAKGYLLKSSCADEIQQAIRHVALNKAYLSQNIAQKIALQKVNDQYDPMQKLTHREFEVFRLLAKGEEMSEIAKQLKVEQKTIANYQTKLKQKLKITNPIQLLRLALKHRVVSMNLSLMMMMGLAVE